MREKIKRKTEKNRGKTKIEIMRKRKEKWRDKIERNKKKNWS